MSNLPDSNAALKSTPAGRERLLLMIMLAASLSTTEKGRNVEFCTDVFLEKLQGLGFHVEVADHQILMSGVD
jgi:hypothetical protein